MKSAALLILCDDAKFSRNQHLTLVAGVLVAACIIAGWMGSFVLAGCGAFLIRGEAEDHASEVKSDICKQNGIRKAAKALSKILAQFSLCQAKLSAITNNRFNRDSGHHRTLSLSIPHPALSARLYPAPIARLA